MLSKIENKTFRQPIAAVTQEDRSSNVTELLLQRQKEAEAKALEQAQNYANTNFGNMATANGWQVKSITAVSKNTSLDVSERTDTIFGYAVVDATLELKYEEPSSPEQPASGSATPPTTEQINNSVNKDGTISNSVNLIFPLVNEVTIKIEDLPKYVSKLTKLFDFYKQQMKSKGLEIKGYDLSSEIGSLLLFFVQLDVAIKAAENLKPSIVTNPDKMSVLDYEFVTLKYIDPPESETVAATGPVQAGFGPVAPLPEERQFSDGTKRLVRLYNRIDNVVLTNNTTGDTLMTTIPLEAGILGINPSTLALIFNIKRIVDEQLNSPVPMDLMLCRGRQTSLSKLEDTFKILGFDVNLLSSKVLVQDFLNAYIHPIKELTAAIRPPVPRGCTDEAKERAKQLVAAVALHDLQTLFRDNKNVDLKEEIEYVKNKQELIEINKICPETVSTIALFEDLKKLDKLGKIFTDFLEKFNLACIVDEALKCVMPQLSCEEILRDLSVDNFEERLQTAFPRMRNVIKGISLNIQDSLKKEEERREAAGEPALNAQQQTQLVLDNINKVIDLEALCKIDIQAIIDLIKALFNIKLPSFNLLDWQFNFKIDFDALVLQAILEALIALIEQLLNELIGCDALDGFVAGIINGNIDAPSGLYGDLLAMAQGDFSFENAGDIIGNGFSNFLSQSSDEFDRLIKFETSMGNPLIGTIANSGTLGVSLTGAGLVTENQTTVNAFGGLVRTSTRSTGSATVLSGIDAGVIDATVAFDVTKLGTTEGQKEFLKEIGKFEYSKRGDQETFQRISDDSMVNLMTDLKNVESSVLSAGRPPPQALQTTSGRATQGLTASRRSRQPQGKNDVFTALGARNKNRHILDALVLQNEIDGKSTLLMKQGSFAEQIKEYVRTCFALLSPSEVIDLLSSKPNLEVKLTITAISKIRFPLLYAIMQYPERHALLFGSLGKLTQLDTIGPRLQLLATSPQVRAKMVDPNICRPFNNIYEFRKILMEQAIEPELANKLMDDLIQDDIKRANNLIDSLGKASKNLAPTELFTNPDSLSVNRYPDGKPIEEIDRLIDGTISDIFDQIKTIFDNEVETYPNATADTITSGDQIDESLPFVKPQVKGFNSPEEPEEPPKNQEFQSLLNSGLVPDGGSRPNRFFNTKKSKKRIGGVFKQIFETLDTTISVGNIGIINQQAGTVESGLLQIGNSQQLINAISGISQPTNIQDFIRQQRAQADENYIFKLELNGILKGDENLQKYFTGDLAGVLSTEFVLTSSANQPAWLMDYSEYPNNQYRVTLRTSGLIPSKGSSPVNFNDKVVFSGNVGELSPGLQQELDQITVNGQKNRVSVYGQVLTDAIRQIVADQVPESELFNLCALEINETYKILLNKQIRSQLEQIQNASRLLELTAADPLRFPDNKTELINLIDLSPLPTEQQIACGIDTHLLQVESVKERIKDRLNNTTPENIVNTNSRINTRYSDGKPGHLSEQLMVGLCETYIRTTILDYIFKGLFVLDTYEFDLTNFSFTQAVYDYLENKIISDIKKSGLEQDFNKEYSKIFELYKKQELIPPEDGGARPLNSIIKYQIDSCLKLMAKMLGFSKEETRNALETYLINFSIGGIQIPPALNNEAQSVEKRNKFFARLPKIDVYSNSLEYLEEGQITTEIIPEHRISYPPRIVINSDGSEEEIPGGSRIVPEQIITSYKPVFSQVQNYASNCEYFSDIDSMAISGNVFFVLEKYVRLEWASSSADNPITDVDYKQLIDSVARPRKISGASDIDITNGVINLQNFRQLTYKLCDGYKPNKRLTLYSNQPNTKKAFAHKPKFGLRLSMIKILNKSQDFNIEKDAEQTISPYYQFGNFRYDYPFGSRQSYRSLEKNVHEKRGVLRRLKKTALLAGGNVSYSTSNPLMVEYLHDFSCTPLITKEIDVPEYMDYITLDSLPLDNQPRPDAWLNSNFIESEYEKAYESTLKQTMLNDPIFDLLVNYSLDLNAGSTLALFNSFLGMNNEPLFKLFDGTKEFIKKNYILNRDSGNFKKGDKNNNYSKNKKNKQSGAPTNAFLKAATTIPINILKGLATAVDPNIFLADKIVLAGKMGFIQPKFKRIEVGDVVKIEGSNETKTIISGEEGVAYDGYYIYQPNGELMMRRNPVSQGSPITEFTVVAEVENKKVKKDREGNPITAQGPGKSGVPYDLKTKSYIDTNVDEERVGIFDIKPSTPIFPGEQINIPYSVASLLLAPLPIFGPSSLTAYNMLMPFGPLFLLLEPLIYETPEFKASIPKTNKKTNTSASLVCEDSASTQQQEE